MYQVGLIGGHGPFGEAMQNWLREDCEFVCYGRRDSQEQLVRALSQPIVVLSIPAQSLEDFLVANQKLLRPDALYIDVCSVKSEPARVMKELLPAESEIIATHPLFGPYSAKDGLQGQKIVVYPVRISPERYAKFLSYLKNISLTVLEQTPEEHDRAMAYVQGLSHYIGRIMQKLDIPETVLSTRAYESLLDMKNVQGNDSDDLFYSIVHRNPYTHEVIAEFDTAREQVDQQFSFPKEKLRYNRSRVSNSGS